MGHHKGCHCCLAITPQWVLNSRPYPPSHNNWRRKYWLTIAQWIFFFNGKVTHIVTYPWDLNQQPFPPPTLVRGGVPFAQGLIVLKYCMLSWVLSSSYYSFAKPPLWWFSLGLSWRWQTFHFSHRRKLCDYYGEFRPLYADLCISILVPWDGFKSESILSFI